MDCEKASDLMMKYMDGVLTEGEAASLNRHIKVCGRCAEDFFVYDGIMNSFSEMTLSEPPEGFERRVMEIVRQLPEMGLKSVNRALYGVIGVFSVLLSLGIILDMNRESILGWMRQYPQFESFIKLYAPVSDAVGSISLRVSTAAAQVSAYLQQVGSNLNYVLLLLAVVLAAAQFVIYRRERVAGK